MSNIDLVLLGLIKQKSQSAYDIKKNIEYRNIPRWVKISEQSIYKKVLQLESKELLNERQSHRQHIPNVGKQMFKQQLALVETLEKWIIDFENSLKEQN